MQLSKLVCMNMTPRLSKEPVLLPEKCVPPERGVSDSALLYMEEIRVRVETVTPLLKEILDYRPAPHRMDN